LDTVRHIKQLGSDTIVYGISGTIARSISIFLVPLYTRVFTPADYGVIAVITSLIALLTAFVILGLDNSSARWFYDSTDIAHRKSIISSWFWTQASISVLAALVLIIFSSPIAVILLGSEEHSSLIRLAALMIPLGTFSKVIGNWLRYQRKAFSTAIFFTFSSLLSIGMIFLFVLVLRKGMSGLYYGHVLASFIVAIIAAMILKTWINPRIIKRQVLKEMLVFGLPLVPASIAAWATASSDRFILNLFLDMSEVGIYSIAATLASVIALLTTAFQMAWGPFAYSILDKPESSIVYSKVLSIYAWGGCFLGTALSLFAPLVLTIFTTPQYFDAASSVPFLVFSQLLIGSKYILSIGSSIAKKSTVVAGSIFIGAGASVAINFLLIPLIGRDGAGISSLIAYVFSAIFLYYFSQHYYPIAYHIKGVLLCFGFAWLLIGIDHFLIPSDGAFSYFVRIFMCLMFIPMAFWMGLVKVVHIQYLWGKYAPGVLKVR
jgi:O-antigen/teichoic acid export membrane protein